jgi:hypothetical protein
MLDQVRSISEADLDAAIAKAKAAGDKPGEWCWESLQPVVAQPGTPTGIASAIEDNRIIAMAAAGSCNGTFGPLSSLIP